MTKVPRLCDRVVVQIGGYEKEGNVVRISDIFEPPMVEVEFKLQEDDDFTVTHLCSLDMIRPAPTRSDQAKVAQVSR